jgi:(R)-2-hydroxyacyl-CoA dehydratese activating ATPase
MFYLGVDIGSITTKVVLLNKYGKLINKATARSGYNGKDMALRLKEKILDQEGLSSDAIAATVATGYGRVTYPADREVSEITCQAKGVYQSFPGARTVIDIGGQDSKVIKLSSNGKVLDFAMNDKCAAGTGRFLEVMAQALEVPLEETGDLAKSARASAEISSFCTVFAESEVISHVAKGAPKADVLAGVCKSVAARIHSMTARTGLEPQLIFTGGVARNSGVADALARELGIELLIPAVPEITAALGAALLARDLKKTV